MDSVNFTLILFHAHSGLRWLIVLVALAALILFGNGWLTKQYFPKPARILNAMYSGLLDAQMLLGIALLISFGLYTRQHFEHMAMLIIAVALAHLPRKWRNSAAGVYHRNTFLFILASLLFIYLGVMLLPGNRW